MQSRIERLQSLIARIDARATTMMNRLIADRTEDGFLVGRYGLAILIERSKALSVSLDGLVAMANRRVA